MGRNRRKRVEERRGCNLDGDGEHRRLKKSGCGFVVVAVERLVSSDSSSPELRLALLDAFDVFGFSGGTGQLPRQAKQPNNFLQPYGNITSLKENFAAVGLSVKDLAVLS
ncbi:hypothetical protein Droror1_Dr00015294, partial [Drosera rotundifolia]